MRHILLYLFLVAGLAGVALYTPVDSAESESSQEQRIAMQDLLYTCDNNTCATQEVTNTFPFDSFVLEWKAGTLTSVRFFEKNTWSGWFDADGENDAPDSDGDTSPYQIFLFNGATGYQIRTPKEGVSAVTATYFTVPLYKKIRTDKVHMAVNEMPADLAIRSRSEWLDAALELPSVRRDELWPAHYGGVKKIVLHHTATIIRDMNGDMLVTGEDYRQAVRAIYNYHAKSRRWGDLGYHYIIDPEGTVWEGRFGGDGVIGGHAHRDSACKKFGRSGIGFNEGSIGISLLGTYEDQDITPQAKEALTSLIARKAWEFDFQPAGNSFFVDKEYPNVIAHRDVDCTTCPGQKLYEYLPSIVEQAQAKYQDYGTSHPRVYQGELLDVFPRTVELKEGEEKEVTIRFRNTGTVAWRNYGDTAIYMADAGIKQHLAYFGALRLAAAEDNERGDFLKNATSSIADFSRAQLILPNVKPGEIGTFALTVKDPPKGLIEERRYVLALGERGVLPLEEIALTVIHRGIPLAGLLQQGDAPHTIFDDSDQVLALRFQNKGTETWIQGEVLLSLFDNGEKSQNVRHKTWNDANGKIAFEEKEVPPDGTATFRIPATPRTIGAVVNSLLLVRGNEKVIGSDSENLTLSITPLYAAQVLTSAIPSAMLTDWRSRASITIKNVGTKTWDQATLASMQKKIGPKSSFYDVSWKGESSIDKAEGVPVGSAVTFLFRMKAPKQQGVYTEKLALVNEKRTIYFLADTGFQKSVPYTVRVDTAQKKVKKQKK